MFLHDIGWCMNDLLVMKPTVARSFGEAVDCELCFSIWVYSVCADLYLCAIFPEGNIPALPLPEFTRGVFYCFQYRSCRMAVHISDTQSTLCMEIRQQNVDSKQKSKTKPKTNPFSGVLFWNTHSICNASTGHYIYKTLQQAMNLENRWSKIYSWL